MNKTTHINTLGQVKNWNYLESHESTDSGLKGKGAKMDKEKLLRWIKKKGLTHKLIIELITEAEKKKRDTKYIKGLWQGYHCLNKILTTGNMVFGNYCRNRACLVCNGIKKGTLINKYINYTKEWKEPYLVTLTIKSIYKNNLSRYIKTEMKNTLRKIINKHYKRHQKGLGIKLQGIRSLECNFNPKKQTYNPHYHLIVPDKETAEIFISEWLYYNKEKAGIQSQHMRRIKNTEKDMTEVIKYGTKIFTDPEMKKGKGKKTDFKIYVAALENIIHAYRNVRQYEHFGFKVSPTPKSKKPYEINKELKQWTFDHKEMNWTNDHIEGQKLMSSNINDNLTDGFENKLDRDLE
jgi:hypothetical protein